MICPKHGIEMRIVAPTRRFTQPLHRCDICIAECRDRLKQMTAATSKYGRVKQQIELSPVIMSERWP